MSLSNFVWDTDIHIKRFCHDFQYVGSFQDTPMKGVIKRV